MKTRSLREKLEMGLHIASCKQTIVTRLSAHIYFLSLLFRASDVNPACPLLITVYPISLFLVFVRPWVDLSDAMAGYATRLWSKIACMKKAILDRPVTWLSWWLPTKVGIFGRWTLASFIGAYHKYETLAIGCVLCSRTIVQPRVWGTIVWQPYCHTLPFSLSCLTMFSSSSVCACVAEPMLAIRLLSVWCRCSGNDEHSAVHIRRHQIYATQERFPEVVLILQYVSHSILACEAVQIYTPSQELPLLCHF